MRIHPERGFTLIELLIVVAIIGILAAIAIPNFLEAQVRGKVARAKSDMRNLATVVEIYYVDHNDYPIVSDENGFAINPYPAAGPEVFETRMSTALTTPISYTSSLPPEPFPNRSSGLENEQYHYCTLAYCAAHDGDPAILDYQNYALSMNSNPNVVKYFLLSHGPDLDHDEPDSGNAATYDPSNGTTSNGDVVYFGPSIGFSR